MRDLESYIYEEFQKNPDEAMRLYDLKTHEESYPHIIKAQLALQLKELESSRQVTLRERKGYLTNIQNGISHMWRDGLELLEQFIKLNLNWGTKLINENNKNGDPDKKYLFYALITNHSRACLMSEEILHLLKGGFPDAAFSRWRSLYETAVTATFIQRHGEDCAEAYLEHDIVDLLKCHKLDKEIRGERGLDTIPDEHLLKLEEEYQEKLKKHGQSFKNAYGWASAALSSKNPQFKDLEESIGQDHMRVYYKQASHKVHAGANGTSSSLGDMKYKGYTPLLRAPSHVGLGGPATLCAGSLCQTTLAINMESNSAETFIHTHVLIEVRNKIEETFAKLHEINPKHSSRI